MCTNMVAMYTSHKSTTPSTTGQNGDNKYYTEMEVTIIRASIVKYKAANVVELQTFLQHPLQTMVKPPSHSIVV